MWSSVRSVISIFSDLSVICVLQSDLTTKPGEIVRWKLSAEQSLELRELCVQKVVNLWTTLIEQSLEMLKMCTATSDLNLLVVI